MHTMAGCGESLGGISPVLPFIAAARGIQAQSADEMQVLPGKGVSGRFKGEAFWLGSHRYLEERGEETDEVHDRSEAEQRKGRTVIVIGNQ